MARNERWEQVTGEQIEAARAKVQAAAAELARASREFLDLTAATNEEIRDAAELIAEMTRDSDIDTELLSERPDWDASIAEQVMDSREFEAEEQEGSQS